VTARILAAMLLSGVIAQSSTQQPPPPKPSAVLRGRVTAADTGRPLRRAQVVAVIPGVQTRHTTSTNVRGEYELRDLPAGRYTLTVSRSGYLPWEYGRRHPAEPGTPIDVGEAETRDKMDFSLPRASAISGRVIDETGEPVAGVTVYVMRPEFFRGRRRLTPISSIRTDDTGQYRAVGLQPGDYVVVATLRETWTTGGEKKQVLGYAPTFFPGAPSAIDATRVKLAAGKDAPNTDIALIPMTAATISGVAVRADGSPIPGATVSLGQNVAGPTFQSFNSITGARVEPDGSWRFRDVAPGEYDLSVSWTTPDGVRESGSMKVTVAGADVDGLSLVAEGPITVTGDVVTDDGTPLPTSNGRLRVVLEQIGPDKAPAQIVSGSENGVVTDAGTFAYSTTRGRAIVRVWALPKGWAVKSVEAGGQDAADGAIEISGGQKFEGVHVVITRSFPMLSGTMTDDQGKSVEGIVAIFPADEKRWLGVADNIRWTRSDQYGRFRFEGVAPGDYLAAALKTAQPADLVDPEYLATLASSAKRLTVRAGQPQTLTLTLAK
jgi:hypothetical protein